MEIELNAVFGMGQWSYFSIFDSFFGGDSIADSRGVQIVMHYGLSKLPSTGYRPRLADDRVGHFLSTVKDFSNDINDTPQVRYVTRWNLEKSNASAEKSPPKKPILFWIEKTVPREYRPYVRAGILEWNKAFDKLGFIEAIEVREQSDLDDFDPEDIRYNTFRWITTSYGFAMGPSRTNPKTGQILDADIIFDEGMIRYWRSEYLRTRGLPEAMGLVNHGERQAFFKLYASQVPDYAASQDILNNAYSAVSSRAAGTAHRASRGGGRAAAQSGLDATPRGLRMLHDGAGGATATGIDGGRNVRPGHGRSGRKSAAGVHRPGDQGSGDARSWTHARLASQLQGQLVRAISRSQQYRDHSQEGFDQLGDGLRAGQFRPARPEARRLFFRHDRPLRLLGNRICLQADQRSETEELAKIAAKIVGAGFGLWHRRRHVPQPRSARERFRSGRPAGIFAISHAAGEAFARQADRSASSPRGGLAARPPDLFMLLGELGQAAYLSSQYIGGEYTPAAHREDPDGKLPFEPIPVAKQREAMKC